MKKVNVGTEGLELLLAQKVTNANEQLKGQELADDLNFLIADLFNLLKNKREISQDVKDVQNEVITKFNSLSE